MEVCRLEVLLQYMKRDTNELIYIYTYLLIDFHAKRSRSKNRYCNHNLPVLVGDKHKFSLQQFNYQTVSATVSQTDFNTRPTPHSHRQKQPQRDLLELQLLFEESSLLSFCILLISELDDDVSEFTEACLDLLSQHHTALLCVIGSLCLLSHVIQLQSASNRFTRLTRL